MRDPRIDRLAKVLVHYSLGVRKGDLVSVGAGLAAEPLVLACFREILRAGAHPWVRMGPDGTLARAFFEEASDAQLKHVNPIELYAMRKIDARLTILAPQNTKALSNVDPKKQAIAGQARRPLMDTFMKRAAKKEDDPARLRWSGTVYPTHAAAQDAEMSLSEYADFVFNAGKLNAKNPVAEWKKLATSQQRLCDYLNRGKEMHIRAPGGTDIRFGIKGRNWINCGGHQNFPDGEVFTGPIENATEGVVRYSFPAVHHGREVNDIRLIFKAGKVVDASATHNEDFLFRMLDQDKGARVLGELALGSNYDITSYSKNTLFDEKIGGTFHAALGAAYPQSGGKNKSGLHWDMVCDLRKGGVVEVDGKVVSRNGKFQRATWPR